MKLTVDLGPNSYPIHIENGILAKTGELVSEVFSGKKIMIVSDDNVFPLYGEIITKALSQGLNATLLFCLTANLLRVSSLCLRSMKH
mgnify:CR=1 FL=1